VSACTRLTMLKFKLVQIIFFAGIVYICLGKYFGNEGVKAMTTKVYLHDVIISLIFCIYDRHMQAHNSVTDLSDTQSTMSNQWKELKQLTSNRENHPRSYPFFNHQATRDPDMQLNINVLLYMPFTKLKYAVTRLLQDCKMTCQSCEYSKYQFHHLVELKEVIRIIFYN